MKTFFLLRHEDVHGNSGVGVVAEGVIFDTGVCAMTWFGAYSTVTIFPSLKVIRALHGHEGKTEIIVDGSKDKKAKEKFASCLLQVALKKCLKRAMDKKDDEV